MTTETKTDNKETEVSSTESNTVTPPAADNKAVFRPLGKYAVVAVIMVSIIITTAIMLDRELSGVNEELAAIESEVESMTAALHTDSTEATVTSTASSESAPAATTTAKAETQEPAQSEAASAPATTGPVAVAPAVVQPVVAAIPDDAQLADPAATASNEPSAAQADAAVTEAAQTGAFPVLTESADERIAEARKAATERKEQAAAKRQERVETAKAEKKQRMTELFDRIKALEAQQLADYRADQDQQIAKLREQVEQQQQMIEALIKRNEESYDLRAANVLKKQETREQMLNRI